MTGLTHDTQSNTIASAQTQKIGVMFHRGKREFKTRLSHPNTPHKVQTIKLKVKQHTVELLWYEANAKTMFFYKS